MRGSSRAAGGPGSRIPPPLHLVTDDEVLADPGFVERARAVLAAAAGPLAGDGTSACTPARTLPPTLALHLRGPRTSGRRLFDLATALLPAARAAGALLLVNDRVDVAGAVGALGVHLGRRSLAVAQARALLGPGAWIGASVHGAGEVRAVLDEAAGRRDGERAGPASRASQGPPTAALPDFLIVGTLYATASHPGRTGAGPDRLREVAGAVEAAGARAGAAAGASRPLPLIGIGGITPERVPEVRAAGAAGVAVLSGVWSAGDPAAAVAGYRAAWEGP